MCLAMVWAGGGFSLWSTFGTMILCSLGWDHGSNITDPIKQVLSLVFGTMILCSLGWDHGSNITDPQWNKHP